MKSLEGALGRLAGRAHRRPVWALLVAAGLTAVGVVAARRLTLDTDLTELLPQSFESVQDLDKLRDRFGGIGYVVVAGYGAEPEQLRRFADDLAPKLRALPDIRFVEHKRAAGFFRDRALYYMSLPDIEQVADRIRAREKWERRQRNPMYVKLDDEPAPSLDFSDLEAKYNRGSDRRLAGEGEEYYLDTRQKMVVLMAKPRGNSADLGFARKVVEQVERLVKRQDLRAYGPDLKVQLTGTYKKKIDQQGQISADLTWSSALATVILLAYLLYHFRSPVAVLLNLVPVAAGLAWTYGFVGAWYGSVNLLTGFLAAILGGLGIEHGIHLLGRYASLRREGATSEAATRETFAHTGASAFVSALVAALTFGSLAWSEFRAFREFGWIAAAGMMLVLAAYVLVLPALLGVCDRLGWRPRLRRGRRQSARLAGILSRGRIPILVGLGTATVMLAITASRVRFNYDFAALEDASLPSFDFDKKTNQVLGYSQTPVVVLTSNPKAERAVVGELGRRKQAHGARSTIDFVAALDDLVPPDQDKKREVLQSLVPVLAKVKRDGLAPDLRHKLDSLKRMVAAEPFSRADLPDSVRRQFLGVRDADSGFVLVFPGISLADGSKVREFAREVRSIDLAGGTRLSAAGEAMILADIIEMVVREGPRILLAALVLVTLALWLTLGRLRLAVLCLLPTLLSILLLVGLMPLVGLPFNYLNILVVPVLIGVTVDAGVHLVGRLSEATDDFEAVYAETGKAIAGGLLTSAVGFGAMWFADHPGLSSIGQLANLGFATNLLVMLVGFPALLLHLGMRGGRARDPEHTPTPAAGRVGAS